MKSEVNERMKTAERAAGANPDPITGEPGEAANPTIEKEYWESVYQTRPYYRAGRLFDSYEPAYRYGWESAMKPEFNTKSFDATETVLHQRWAAQPGSSLRPSWVDIKEPARDAWERVRRNGHKT